LGSQAGAWEPERKLKLVTRGGRGEQKAGERIGSPALVGKAFARSYGKT